MSDDYYRVARKFWTRAAQYPGFDHTGIRRFHDLRFIAPRVGDAASYLDIGCGDGGTAVAVREVTRVRDFHLIDQSQKFVTDAKRRWGRHPTAKLHAAVLDLSSRPKLPPANVAVLFGVMPYLFDDAALADLLDQIHAPTLLVRSPCTMFPKDELINKHSDALGSHYAAVYRTLSNTLAILNEHFTVTGVSRIWPDEIESKFGTKQFAFHCQR